MRFRWIGLAVALTALAAAVIVPLVRTHYAATDRLGYTELLAALDAGRVAELTIRPGEGVHGRWAPGRGAGERAEFVVVYPVESTDALIERAERARAAVSFELPVSRNRYSNLLQTTLQALLIGGLCYLLYVQLKRQNGGDDVGRRAGASRTTFADVAGTQGAAEELHELVEFLRAPEAFTALGARVPKGVLLVGPPGTGKTLLARALAGEAGVPFFQVSGAEVTGFIVGLGAHRVRSLFRRARKRGGVIFVDEIDSLGGRRGRNRSHNEDDRTLNQLLVEMDGFHPSAGVVVVGATNRADDLDPALLRPGRFDRTITVGLPSTEGRAAILRLHAERRAIPFGDDVDLDRLARLTPGANGAELANLLNEAAIAAVREQAARVGWRHFELARDRMLLGKERVGFRAQQQEWQVVAYHEAGHALAGLVHCPEDGLHKVTIQARGQAMGVAHFAPDDDRHLHTRRYLEGLIVKGLAGRAAEELAFGTEQITSGAESDLVQVNRIARRMVYRLGMGGATGLLIYDEPNVPLSAEAQAGMDAEVCALLARLYVVARATLEQHRPALDALAAALLERETLTGDEVRALLAQHGVRPPLVSVA